MTQTVSSGQVTALVTGNVIAAPPGLPSGGTVKYWGPTTGTGAAQTVATVTAGKSAVVLAMSATGTAASSVALKDSGSTTTVSFTIVANGTFMYYIGGTPISQTVYASTTNILAVTSATGTTNGVYYEY